MKMNKRPLGKSGIEVSPISFGCEGFMGMPIQKAKEITDYAVEQGVNFIDLFSSDPELRSTIGEMIKDHPDFKVQGHLCSVWKDGQYRVSRNISEVKTAFEDLLTRLGRDKIDVGMIHYVDSAKAFHTIFDGPVMEYALELKKNGVVKALGISSHNPVVARMAVETGLIDVLLFSVNPCYDTQPPDEDLNKLLTKDLYTTSVENFNSERESLYELCERNGVGIDVMKAYAGGDLLKAAQSPFGRAFTVVQCLNYALTRPAVAAVMAGVKSLQEVKDALAWVTATDEEKDYSKVLVGLDKYTWNGHCMYCGHCAPCPKNIRVADVSKFLSLALTQEEIPETVREHYKALEHHASECIQCGACETRCPFNVPIREKMKQAAQVFGY